MIRSPVVRMADGTYVPRQTMRSRFRGNRRRPLNEFCPMHLIDCGVYAINSSRAEWILREIEDNYFISPESSMDRREFCWNSMAGLKNILPASLAYLKRGQYKHAVPRFDFGFDKPAKMPCGAHFLVWYRHMLIAENGNNLDLLPGVPVSWLTRGKQFNVRQAPTWFGPVDLHVLADADMPKITVKISGPQRNPPEKIRLYLRTPAPFKSVALNASPVSTFDADKRIITLPGKIGQAVITVMY